METTALDVYNSLLKDLKKLDGSDLHERSSTLGILSGDFQEKINQVFGGIHMSKNLDFHHVSEVVVNVNIAKMFFEVIVSITYQPHLKELEEYFSSLSNGNRFLNSVLSIDASEVTAAFAAAESAAFYAFACHKFSNCREAFKVVYDFLVGAETSRKTSFGLLVLERLCELRERISCDAFDESLIGEDGVISNIIFMGQMWNGPQEHQLRLFRVCSKLLEIDLGAVSLLKHIDPLLSGHERLVQNPVSRFQYLRLLKSMFPYPGEVNKNCDCVPSAASEVLEKFLHDEEMWRHRKTPKCFGGKGCEDESCVDMIIFVNLILKLVLSLSEEDGRRDSRYAVLRKLREFVSSDVINKYNQSAATEADLPKELISLFIEQDDELVDFVSFQLQLHCTLDSSAPGLRLEDLCTFDPHHLFLELLTSVSFDSSVFLDWLVSNETRFLQYFVKYLKFTLRRWDDLVKISTKKDGLITSEPGFSGKNVSNSQTSLDTAIAMMGKLKNSILRLDKAKLFPYTPKPLIKLLDAVELKFNHENAFKSAKSS